MKYTLQKIEPSRDGKTKYVATFSNNENDRLKTVKFGIKDSFSYVDGAPEKVRAAYRARHARDYINKDPLSRGALSAWITWGNSQDIEKNIREYRKLFNV